MVLYFHLLPMLLPLYTSLRPLTKNFVFIDIMVAAEPNRNNSSSHPRRSDDEPYYDSNVNNDDDANSANGNRIDASSSPHAKPSLTIYNHFENYRLLKQQQKLQLRQQRQRNFEVPDVGFESHDSLNANDAAAAGAAAEDDDGEEDNGSNLWKHFISPLQPRLRPGEDDDDSVTPSTRRNSQRERQEDVGGINHGTRPSRSEFVRHRPSVFTDLERSETVDRFANIFVKRMNDALSSGTLAKAWRVGARGDDEEEKGGGMNFGDAVATEKIRPSDYRAERKMIQAHLTPFIWGSSCMVITLFSLRFGRWYHGSGGGAIGTGKGANVFSQAFPRSWTSASRGNSRQNVEKTIRKDDVTKLEDLRQNPFRKTPHGTHGNSSTTPTTATPSDFNANHNPLEGLQTLPVDLAVSILVGTSTTLFLSDSSALMKDFSHAPLVSGRSVLSEELCEPFVEEMRRVNRRDYTYNRVVGDDGCGKTKKKEVVSYRELWKEENLGEFESLRAVRDFVENCQRRKMVARKILGERKMTEEEEGDGKDLDLGVGECEYENWKDVSIPYPGVSPSLSLDGFIESIGRHDKNEIDS